jgi:hypothetical protein
VVLATAEDSDLTPQVLRLKVERETQKEQHCRSAVVMSGEPRDPQAALQPVELSVPCLRSPDLRPTCSERRQPVLASLQALPWIQAMARLVQLMVLCPKIRPWVLPEP